MKYGLSISSIQSFLPWVIKFDESKRCASSPIPWNFQVDVGNFSVFVKDIFQISFVYVRRQVSNVNSPTIVVASIHHWAKRRVAKRP